MPCTVVDAFRMLRMPKSGKMILVNEVTQLPASFVKRVLSFFKITLDIYHEIW